MVLGYNLRSVWGRREGDSEPQFLLNTTHENELKIGERPKGKTRKFAEKEIEEKFCNFGVGKVFLARTQKAQTMKEKNGSFGLCIRQLGLPPQAGGAEGTEMYILRVLEAGSPRSR